jgi:hypothetical protein
MMLHGPFALPTIQYLKPLQAQQFLVRLFNIPFLADWNKVGDYRQRQTGCNTAREKKTRVEWDYAVGDKVLLHKEGFLCKSESKYEKEPWTVSQVHMNGTIRIQCGTKSERLNIRQVTPFFEEIET